MPRIGYIEESKKTPQIRAMIEFARENWRAGPSRGQYHDAQRGWFCVGRVLEQDALRRLAPAQAQGNVPHPNFSRAPVRLLLDGALQYRQDGRPYRGHDQ